MRLDTASPESYDLPHDQPTRRDEHELRPPPRLRLFDAELNEYHCHTCGALDLAYEAHKADEKAAADEEATR